jgi:hypothetical protein
VTSQLEVTTAVTETVLMVPQVLPTTLSNAPLLLTLGSCYL